MSDCLESLLTQITDFPFEVLVGDDASTDATRSILESVRVRWPDRLRLVLHDANMGPAANYVAVHRQARGRFVAHMDGDDLALPGKLQRQVDEFRRRPDASIVAHDVALLDQAGQRLPGTYSPGHPAEAGLAYLVRHGSYFAHSSKMYRRELGPGAPGPHPLLFDFLFHVEHAGQGPILWLPDVLGARRLGVGISWDPAWRERLHKGKAQALARARELGCPEPIVQAAQSENDYAYATWFLARNDLDGFAKAIALAPGQWRSARVRHRALHLIRHRTGLLRSLLWTWNAIRPLRRFGKT